MPRLVICKHAYYLSARSVIPMRALMLRATKAQYYDSFEIEMVQREVRYV